MFVWRALGVSLYPTVSEMVDRTTTNDAAFQLLGDALSSVTRTSRRNVIVFSSLCLLAANTGVNPTNISIPFFKFENLSENFVVLSLLAFTITSFLSFIVNAWSDVLRFRHRVDKYNLTIAFEIDSALAGPPDEYEEYREYTFEEETGYRPFVIPHSSTTAIKYVKLFFDFVFPFLFGLGSILIYVFKLVF